MLKGIAHFERTNNLWTIYHDDEALAETEPQWIRQRKWHGVISRHTTKGFAEVCTKLRIPLVDLNDVDPFPGIPKIRPDNNLIGQRGAEHFLERGYRNFGFAGFSNLGWSCERRDGFLEAVLRSGHKCSLFDVVFPGCTTPFWVEKQIEKLSLWLKGLAKPIGVMATFDLRAQQLINAAYDAGILVPEEIAVIGVNNDTHRCEMTVPAISSVAPNAFQSGFRAASLLNDMLAGRKIDKYDQRVEPLGVVARHSTDILAIDDEKIAAAVNFIRQNACGGLTADQVADHAHISRSLLEKKFRHYIGRSPQSEIRRMQIGKISQLLVDTDFPLKRIAELTGFDYTEYMCVLFKRMTGYPPGAFREKMQNKAIVRSIVSDAQIVP
jgi:LacI family transcriptional regulator